MSARDKQIKHEFGVHFRRLKILGDQSATKTLNTLVRRLLNDIGYVENVMAIGPRLRLRGWIRYRFQDLPTVLKSRAAQDREGFITEFVEYIDKAKRYWENTREFIVARNIPPTEPPEEYLNYKTPEWWLPKTDRAGGELPAPPPPGAIKASELLQWGQMAPKENQDLAELSKEQARAFINQWKARWETRIEQWKTRVENAQATFGEHPARCPAEVREKFTRSIAEILQEWSLWRGAAERWYKSYWNALHQGTDQGQLTKDSKMLAERENILTVKSDCLMQDQVWQWENVPSVNARKHREDWFEYGFDFNSTLVRYDVPIDIRNYDDQRISRIRLHNLLPNPNNPRLKSLLRPWVKVESLRITELVDILREKGVMKEGQDLMFYQQEPSPRQGLAEKRTYVTNDITLQTTLMNHMKETWPGLCGRQTRNERSKRQPKGSVPLYALKVSGRPKGIASGSANIAAAKALAAGTGKDLDIRTYLSELGDKEEADELRSLFEDSEEEIEVPSSHSRSQLLEELEKGEHEIEEEESEGEDQPMSVIPEKRKGGDGDDWTDSDDDDGLFKSRQKSRRV